MWAPIFWNGRVKKQERAVRMRAWSILKLLKLDHVADELAANLSTGQKKLLELGRTLMADPQLVLLDEPAAGVNPTLMQSIAQTIRKLRDERGITFVIVEHDVPLIMDICDEVIVLAQGKVIAAGPPDEVRHDARVLEAYLGGVDA